MTVEDKFTLFGADGLFSNGIFLAQFWLFVLTLLVLAGAFVVCMRALRAAATARAVQGEAHAMYESMERQAQTMQMIGDDVQRMSHEIAARHEDLTTAPAAPVATERSHDDANGEPVRSEFADGEPEEKKPGALFRGLLRRR